MSGYVRNLNGLEWWLVARFSMKAQTVPEVLVLCNTLSMVCYQYYVRLRNLVPLPFINAYHPYP